MKVVGIIAEYNPFHLGHKYHLEMSKKLTNSEYSIAIMSGSFVQRGEPSIVDKWTKAKMAIDNGVDLVIELPFIFATQSAELFAYGSIALLNSLKIVDFVCFGSEVGNLDILKNIANVLVKEPPFYKNKLKKYLKDGNSFSISRSKALSDYYEIYGNNSFNIEKILNSPNNILAIEYLKALIRLNSNITPVTIKRIYNQFNDTKLRKRISSATAIRKKLLENPKDIHQIRKYVPANTYKHLSSYIETNSFNSLNNYNQIIHYLLRIKSIENLINIMDVEIGLENRIMDMSGKFNDVDSFISSIVTKRYPRTRIQRIIIHLMMDLFKEEFIDLFSHYPAYIRVLGSNDKGFELLRKIKEKSEIPIITKFSNYKKLKNTYINKIISYDKKSTDLFFLGINCKPPYKDRDNFTTCYINKKSR